ncbi:MAG: hypothetical protein KF819_27885 [Labilithrix sp.]|nr:hypothetical protein [Labilithrix sp.]
MLKRLIVGLVLGCVIGAVVAAVFVQGLGMAVFSSSVVAYLAAAATGVITGLVAGKPIWAADGKIEAGLKAFAGILLGLGAMLVLRWWVKVDVDLTSLKAGQGSVGDLPAVSLPAIAALLAGFYELDNSPSPEKKEEAKAGAKSGAGKKVRVETDDDEGAEDEEEEQPASVKKKTR